MSDTEFELQRRRAFDGLRHPGGEKLFDSLGAKAGIPGAPDRPGEVARNGAVVGVDERAERGIEGLRQPVRRHEAGPIGGARPAGHRHPAASRRSERDAPGGDEADVAVDVDVEDILLRCRGLLRGRQQLPPVARPVEGDQGVGGAIAVAEVGRGERCYDRLSDAGIRGQRRRRGHREPRQIGNHWAVPGRAHRPPLRRRALDGDDLVAGDEGPRSLRRLVAVGIGGVDTLDEDVFDIDVGTGDPPGDPRVTAENDGGKPRRCRAGQLSPRGDEARQVPRQRQGEAEVQIVGENGLAARGSASRDDPGIGRAERLAGRFRRGREPGRHGAVEPRWRRGEGRRRIRRVVRPQLAELPRRQPPGETRPQQLVVAVAGQPHRHQFQPDEQSAGVHGCGSNHSSRNSGERMPVRAESQALTPRA